MKFEELKQRSNTKILLTGKSGRGKTYTASQVAIEISKNGGKVKYADTESEGTDTMFKLVSEGDYGEEDIKNINYEQVGEYERLHEIVENTEEYDLLIVDTLDHKHTMALKYVTDAKMKEGAEWNEYPAIYSAEKQIMEKLSKPSCNILCTLDPESGKSGKPKGAQTNIRGYFSVVLRMVREGDGWTYKVLNYVGRGDLVGKKPDVTPKKVCTKEIGERI